MIIKSIFRNTLWIFVILLMLSFSFTLNGCNLSEKESVTQNDINVIQNQIAPIMPIDFNVDIEPEPLKETAKTLTLEGYGAKGALADKDLTINDMLTYAVQDEYLAHAEYIAVMEKFGNQRPYANIAKSEETHLSYLEEIYMAYEMDFPEDVSADHVIVPETLLEAAKLGVQAEVDNIAMYELFMSFELPENVYKAFYILKSGSENHLEAFKKQVNRLS